MTAQQEREAVAKWAEAKCAEISGPLERHVLEGGDLNDPDYRLTLGQHQAFMRLRSFLSQRGDHIESKG